MHIHQTRVVLIYTDKGFEAKRIDKLFEEF